MNRALDLFWRTADQRYFLDHPDRKAHIRNAYSTEMQGEFWSLGEHDRNRQRVILLRADNDGNFLPDRKVLKIPFLAFADESIEDTDAVLLPIVKQMMAEAFQREKRR